ncbi:MAG: hypothetical protein M1821_005757 [Bathelium mastoideum]|nr:MAG: hypothetical protein M1821_005757 [Bathelium mastoideum]
MAYSDAEAEREEEEKLLHQRTEQVKYFEDSKARLDLETVGREKLPWRVDDTSAVQEMQHGSEKEREKLLWRHYGTFAVQEM